VGESYRRLKESCSKGFHDADCTTNSIKVRSKYVPLHVMA